MEKRENTIGLFALIEARVLHFRSLGKVKTSRNYACALRQVWLFRGGCDIPLCDVSAALMRDFQDFLQQRGLRRNTISLYMRVLRAAYNHAVDDGLISVDRRPMRKVFTGRDATPKRALDGGVVRALILADCRGDGPLEFARDMFLFSIYMQGMAFVDIAYLQKSQYADGCVAYCRHKTGRLLVVGVQPCALEIIRRYAVADDACPYLFPILYNPLTRSPVSYDTALRTHNKRLGRLASALGMQSRLTSYVARHTWASLAKRSGVSVNVICEAMGHSSPAVTGIYLAELDADVVTAANRKVLYALSGV